MTGAAFTIRDIDVLPGIGGHWCNDQPAVQAAAEADGFFFAGAPVTPGFTAIREPSEALLCILTLADGTEALGDCTTVANAGYSGRPPPLRASQAATVKRLLKGGLEGRTFAGFLDACGALDALDLPPALVVPVAYGVSQALLAASAAAGRRSMAAVLRAEFGGSGVPSRPGLAASCGNEGRANVDKAIARRVAMFPQSAIQTRAECEALPEFVEWIAARLRRIAPADYRPDLHFDFHSALGRMYGNDEKQVIAYLGAIVRKAGGLKVYFEDPLLSLSAREAAERSAALRRRLSEAGVFCGLIVDQWANENAQLPLFLNGAADAVQIKMPDNGSILRTIRAVEACRAANVLPYLGGSCNETDVSARVTAHIAVAMGVWRVFTKPGLGFDEGVMILTNEMERALRSLTA